jgi:hypothetical protein
MRVGSSSMVRRITIDTTSFAVLTLSPAAFAQQGQLGTGQEAAAMLDKAVVAVKSDQAVALAMFNKGEGGFRDRDLYPFCFRIADGKGLATPLRRRGRHGCENAQGLLRARRRRYPSSQG